MKPEISSLIHGPVKNELTEDQLNRISKIWDKIKDFDDNLETFELNFMRDAHPDNEIKIWENIVKTLEICTEKIKTEWSEVSIIERKHLYQEIIKITVGHYTNEEILNDNNLKFIVLAYVQAKKINAPIN